MCRLEVGWIRGFCRDARADGRTNEVRAADDENCNQFDPSAWLIVLNDLVGAPPKPNST